MVSGAIRATEAWAKAVTTSLILLLVAFDHRPEPVETDGPEFFPLPQPLLRLRERLGPQAANVLPARLSAFDQTRAFKHFHVLRSAGERHRERFAQLAHRFLAERQVCQHSAPRRIRQSVEGDVESIFNHVV
jgi:hypothetical protein